MSTSHKPSIKKRLKRNGNHTYLSDMIYGGIDGSISTLAIVAGVAGAGLSIRINIILGIASLIADAFSMATSNYVSVRSEFDKFEYYSAIVTEQIDDNPQQEIEKVRQIYKHKGFDEEARDHIARVITSDKTQWLKTMLREEYGLPESVRFPWTAAIATFIAFIICGVVPLLPYLLSFPKPFEFACGLTGMTFFMIGSIKSRWSIYSWWRSGLTTLVVGGIAALIAFYIGYFVEIWLRG